MKNPFGSVIFYSIEKAIKSYRQFAQIELRRNGLKITVDQLLLLKSLLQFPTLSQNELAAQVFKDAASVIRILDILVKSHYISRKVSAQDARRSQIKIISDGRALLKKAEVIVTIYRQQALKGIGKKETLTTSSVLNRITSNCV